MIETAYLPLFLTATLVLLLTPGPAVFYIIARSVSQGRMAGIVSVLGLELGTLCHALAAALGLSTLLLSSAIAFAIVKYLGAAYLVYLGIRKLAARDDLQQGEIIRSESLWRVFWQGVVVNLFNPKTALFLFAFLPQFVDVRKGSVMAQMLSLGILFVVLATLSDGAYALLAGSIGNWLRGNKHFTRELRYFAGSVYIGLGIITALSGARSK